MNSPLYGEWTPIRVTSGTAMDGRRPCDCETCRRPVRDNDGPRPPCLKGKTFDFREGQNDA